MVSRCHPLCHALPLVALWRGPIALSAIPSLSEMVQRCSSAPVALEFNKRNRRAFADVALDPNYDEFDEEEMLGPHWLVLSQRDQCTWARFDCGHAESQSTRSSYHRNGVASSLVGDAEQRRFERENGVNPADEWVVHKRCIGGS